MLSIEWKTGTQTNGRHHTDKPSKPEMRETDCYRRLFIYNTLPFVYRL